MAATQTAQYKNLRRASHRQGSSSATQFYLGNESANADTGNPPTLEFWEVVPKPRTEPDQRPKTQPSKAVIHRTQPNPILRNQSSNAPNCNSSTRRSETQNTTIKSVRRESTRPPSANQLALKRSDQNPPNSNNSTRRSKTQYTTTHRVCK